MSERVCPNCGNPYQTGDEACNRCGTAFPLFISILTSGTTLRGRYEIQDLIHSGGMGYVYAARDHNLFDRPCVVKQVRERITSGEHQRKLEEEAMRMARLSHPSIAILFDHFVEEGFYFLVMERIQGKTLSEVFKERRGSLSEEQVVNWGASICDVMEYLHGQQVVHRDISPDNVMLTDEGNIKFIDFGTLRDARYSAAGKTAGMGKYGYTPPEQWEGRPTEQSDVFALGATLYYLLTGFLPLSRSYQNGRGPHKDDLRPQFPPIRTRCPQVSVSLEAVLQKSLQLDPKNRYASAAEMREDLKALRATASKRDEGYPVTIALPGGEARNVHPSANRQADGRRPRLSDAKESKGKRADSQLDSESAIRRESVSSAVQHPAVLLLFAIAIISAIYLILLSPIFGGWQVALASMVTSALAALSLFLLSYPKEYLANTRRMMERLDTERSQMEEDDLRELRETLRSGFSSVGSASGARTLSDLQDEYEQLQTALSQHRATDPLSVSVIPALSGETYRRGLSVLSDTLDLMNVIQTPGRSKLEREIVDLEDEIELLKKSDGDQGERLKLKLDILSSLRERLSTLDRLQLYVDQLLYQAQRCDASLHGARIQLATIRAGSTKTNVDSVIQALQERIDQVREVQEEFNRLGY